MNSLGIWLALWLMFSPVTFGRDEYPRALRVNMEVAAWRVYTYFENHSIREGRPFSFLRAVGNDFYDGVWVEPSGYIVGSGACEIATLLYRAAMAEIGPDFEVDTINMVNYWMVVVTGERYTLTYVHHRDPWPADLLGIGKGYSNDPTLVNDFTLTLNEDTHPRGTRLYFWIDMDAQGNFYAELRKR